MCCLLFYFCRYHKSQAIYLESKENTKISCVISSVGANEVGGCSGVHGSVQSGRHQFSRALRAGTAFREDVVVWCLKKLDTR